MARITNKVILEKFNQEFERGIPFTPSENRMNGIKLAALKKTVKKFIEENNVETDLSVEQIILDAIDFAVLTNMKYRSVASLGYQQLPQSISYWQRRRTLEESQTTNNIQESEKIEQESIANNFQEGYNKTTPTKKAPKWLQVEEW